LHRNRLWTGSRGFRRSIGSGAHLLSPWWPSFWLCWWPFGRARDAAEGKPF